MQLHAGAPRRAPGAVRGEAAPNAGRRLVPAQAAAGEPAAKAAAVDAGRLTLRLSTHYRAQFGEQLKVVGSAPELGCWDPAEAPALAWTEGHHWVSELQLPRGQDVRFKVVLLSHAGVCWEPGTDRALTTEPEADELAVRLAWGVPELQLLQPAAAPEAAQPQSAAAAEAEARASLDKQFDSLWNPVSSGLPSDITSDLSAVEREPKAKHAVTLEPEFAIFADEEAQAAVPVAAAAAPALKPQRAPAPEPVAIAAAAPPAKLAGAAESEEAALPPAVAAAAAEVRAAEGQKAAKVSALRAAGQAAGVAAAGVAAAVLFSALAVDLTDAAIASAVVAAGATLLPGTDGADGRKQAKDSGKGAASPLLGAVELGLKAQALLQGKKARRGGKSAKVSPAVPSEEEREEEARWAALLPQYVAAKSAQAQAWAAAFQPTEEELWEMSAPAFVRVEGFANNAVSIEGMGSRKADEQQKAAKRK